MPFESGLLGQYAAVFGTSVGQMARVCVSRQMQQGEPRTLHRDHFRAAYLGKRPFPKRHIAAVAELLQISPLTCTRHRNALMRGEWPFKSVPLGSGARGLRSLSQAVNNNNNKSEVSR